MIATMLTTNSTRTWRRCPKRGYRDGGNTWSIFINGFFPKTASHSPHLAPILVALFIFVSFCLTAMVCVVWSLLTSVY